MKHPAWKKLEDHHKGFGETLAVLFSKDPRRFDKFSLRLPGLLFDYSKNLLTEETLQLLLGLAREAGIETLRDKMFAGEKINDTDGWAVLHTALRAPKDFVISVDGKNVMPEIHAVLEQMEKFSEAVRSGVWKGATGKNITDIVSIGIGGSVLGARLATEALGPYHHPRLRVHYVSNVEASDLDTTLMKLSPDTTLFFIASKSFTTVETMQNAQAAKNWLLKSLPATAVAQHFTAASTNSAAVRAFGIAAENMFPFSDWVGGRYSCWSAIGLPVMLAIGARNFFDFLKGAGEMDAHFKTAPLQQNIPVIMGLIGLWYHNFCRLPAYAVAPYHSNLRHLPQWLQQVDMESNGKCVDRQGKPVDYTTGPLVFGEAGTDAQHSFFQWLHQGTAAIPTDFIAAIKTPYGTPAQQTMLLANMLAQAEALMTGQKNTEAPHRHFPGNRPSSTLLLDELTPRTLGLLMALYEHRVFVQGTVWNINSFDQYGVELGKVLAQKIDDELSSRKPAAHDASTAGLMRYILSKE